MVVTVSDTYTGVTTMAGNTVNTVTGTAGSAVNHVTTTTGNVVNSAKSTAGTTVDGVKVCFWVLGFYPWNDSLFHRLDVHRHIGC